jgi:hypothetical protein
MQGESEIIFRMSACRHLKIRLFGIAFAQSPVTGTGGVQEEYSA